MSEIKKTDRIRLTDKGYKKVCAMVDERDGGRCILCGRPWGLHHHHVKFRSALGSDTEDNLVLLCFECHQIYAHGKKERAYRDMFLEYLQDSATCCNFRIARGKDLQKIYDKYKKK